MDVTLDPEEYLRVLKYARQPDTDEFLQVAGISAIGVGIVGTLGFLMFAVLQFLP